MILLKATSESLQIVTTTTANVDYSISYADITTTAFTPSTSEGKITTATTTTALAAPAASTQRQVKLITISNIDGSASNTIIVQKLITATTYRLTPTIILLAGETMQYMDGQGWTYYSATGAVKGNQTAAGSDTQLQYNSGGAVSGDPDLTWNATTNELTLGGVDTSIIMNDITNEPSPSPAGELRLYAKNISGRSLLKFVGPAGIDSPYQPAFFGNNITMWSTTTATAGLWYGTAGSGAGTYSTSLATFTNTYTAIKRGVWSNVVTTTNQVIGQRNTEAMFFRGSIAGTGGFFFTARFGFNTWTAGCRLFVGMHTATTVVSANPSASLNIVGFGIDAGDTAITFMHNAGTGTATKETITGQPTLANNQGYDAYIFCRPNDSTVYYRLVDLLTGTEIVSSSVTLNLPVATTGMTAGVLGSNAALTTVNAIQLGLNRIYVESDY
jgi:hypothetical protein